MTDHKFDRQYDRIATPKDLKDRLIDLRANSQPLPEVGIYDEPVRYFKANEEWCKVIFGWLDWLEDIAGWPDAEDESYAGIQAILIFEEGIDMATQEDIAKGMYQAFNWLALQVATGQYANINLSTDADGTVSLPSGDNSDAGLPEDDPETDFDETEAARYGAMIEIAAKLELVIDKLDTFYGNTNGTPTTPEADATALMIQYFICDATLMETGVIAYYAYRMTQGKMFFDVNATFIQYLYCNGYQNDALNRWLQDVSTFTFAKQQVFAKLWESLGDEFFSNYFSIGAEKPSNAYLDAPCVPIAPQTLENLLFAVARTTTPFKASHRMKFRISGYALDVDGDIQDAFWYRTAAGVVTRSNWTFVHSAGSNQPSDNQVVYNSAHVYEYTIDLGALNGIMTITPVKNAGMNAAGLTYPVPFEVEIIDLGLAISQ